MVITGYGNAIKSARKAAGMTQAQLAEKCGLALITIGQYERDLREPRREQLERIATALNIELSELFAQEPAKLNGLLSGKISPENIAVKRTLENISYNLYRLNKMGLKAAEERIAELTEIEKYRQY